MSEEHTPLPELYAYGDCDNGVHLGRKDRDQNGSRFASIYSTRKVAESVVTACNSYDQDQERIKALEEALEEIRDAEDTCCPRCEGNGNLYADGKTHLMSENAPTMLCGSCGGGGRIQPENAQDIAAAALAKKGK